MEIEFSLPPLVLSTVAWACSSWGWGDWDVRSLEPKSKVRSYLQRETLTHTHSHTPHTHAHTFSQTTHRTHTHAHTYWHTPHVHFHTPHSHTSHTHTCTRMCAHTHIFPANKCDPFLKFIKMKGVISWYKWLVWFESWLVPFSIPYFFLFLFLFFLLFY